MLATTQSIKPEPPWHLTPSPFNYSPLIFKQNRGKKFSPGKRQHKLFNVRSLSVWLSQFLSRYSISSPFTFSHRDFYSCTSLSPFFFSCFHHPHLSCLPDFPSYAVSGFSYGFIKKQQQTDLHRWVFWEKVSVLTCIHQCHRSQLVSPRQHPDITAGVTNGCDTLVPFLTALSLCSRAFLAATFSEIQWVSLTATAVNIYF